MSNKSKSIIIYGGSRPLSNEQSFSEECNGYEYIPNILNPTSRTIAIGDIHGDLVVAIKMLEIAGCIQKVNVKKNDITTNLASIVLKNNNTEYYKWIGKDTIVVQVGDQVDRCRPIDGTCDMVGATPNDEASDIKILKFYTDVNQIARKDNGRVISLLGNHELMNVQGNLNYVSLFGLLQYVPNVNLTDIQFDGINIHELIKQGKENRILQFSNQSKVNNDNNGLPEKANKYLACTRLSAVIVGDILFVHGGLIKKMAESYNIDDLNLIVRRWLLGKLSNELESKSLLYTIAEKNKLNDNNNLLISFNLKDRLKLLLTSKYSIFWNRVLGQIPADISINSSNNNDTKTKVAIKCDEYLKPVFKLYNINGIIIGHTPQISDEYGINSACNKAIWRVDIGASSAFEAFKDHKHVKNRLEVLEITYLNSKPQFKILDDKIIT
jgi:hypothetical protein